MHAYRVLGREVTLAAGVHEIELVYLENTGHAQVEFFYADAGLAAFSAGNFQLTSGTASTTNNFRLFGDFASGGNLQFATTGSIVPSTSTVPLPPAAVLLVSGLCLPLMLARRPARA